MDRSREQKKNREQKSGEKFLIENGDPHSDVVHKLASGLQSAIDLFSGSDS